jgi:TorA maturation chaperone TorD
VQLPAESHLFPDHVSVELDCLASLLERDRHEAAADFARDHLLRWLPRLARHVEQRAELAFYRTWVAGLLEMLGDLFPSAPNVP